MKLRHLRGFTLLELLVVLVLTSFITVLLMQGMAYVAKVNETFLLEGQQRQARELVFGWFIDSVAAISAPERGGGSGRFRGDAKSFEAVTLASVDRREGVPVAFAFRLDATRDAPTQDADLVYVRRLEANRWPLLQLPGDAQFEYLDSLGAWHENWPPSSALVDSLPEAVALSSKREQLFLLATVQSPRRRLSVDDH
ncbi:prepilin-type N-terminal cleavage/methylation domain-containing protein [Pseudomonas sp. ZM23]|uniref:Prepilin-type N-terminal cleavage/methylation domain-containing protein n=1 Tax=Pseudomonas triclosanedens TaxID=2961893 RepID=A0ABY7A3I0_9PSED|nr:prepilin-type N-terminal cleavage/methylation domain-containing protein [Pseudomonas triclosanedens]MCP8464764.1 prepilin-type N-terminal cleavage/methylation domain-containing protein [Pseudomonas triclosanedens]MCP8470523.1 prepilin-type N-terminal cleavage/methylation domain-containing protein [Pseudomonas triclosanedens]MCP8476329.1 prepilin-type N-terminal cleavage/methylation domain-containing protein [Pseudomonas triclosanedens]WAI51442.1 prepilin-type N-terminal cleavage/methylation 